MKFIFVLGMSDLVHQLFVQWHEQHNATGPVFTYDSYYRDGDFEVFANWVGHDWVLRARMGTIRELMELGAKPYVIWERCPVFLFWDYQKRVFVMTNPEIEGFYYECHPICPGIFDIPYNNSSRRSRVLNSFYVSLLETSFMPTAGYGHLNANSDIVTKVAMLTAPHKLNGFQNNRQMLFICKLFFCPNVDILEMALVLFVETFIEQARLHRNTAYFIDTPDTLPSSKRARITVADE